MTTTLDEAPLASSETRQRPAAGEMLFLEGETPAGVYVLHSGEVDLLFVTGDRKAKPLRAATPGQMLGLSAVIMRRPHDCSAIARTPCDVGFIGRDKFLRSLHDTPAIWLSVLRTLSRDVNAVYNDMRARRRVMLVTSLNDRRHQSMVASRLSSSHDTRC